MPRVEARNGVPENTRWRSGGITCAIGLLFYPPQIGGNLSKGAQFVLHARDCGEVRENPKAYDPEKYTSTSHYPPIIGRHWWTKSEITPGRMNLHIDIDPPYMKSTDRMAVTIAGKAGVRQSYSMKGYPQQGNGIDPPDDGECTTWWTLHEFESYPEGDMPVRSVVFEGLYPERKYCIAASVAPTLKLLGTSEEASTGTECWLANWNSSWGWIGLH